MPVHIQRKRSLRYGFEWLGSGEDLGEDVGEEPKSEFIVFKTLFSIKRKERKIIKKIKEGTVHYGDIF